MSIYVYILVMAVTTYLVRAIPLTLMKKPIKNRFVQSFLHYVPTACLTAMTFPAILYATDHILSGAFGLAEKPAFNRRHGYGNPRLSASSVCPRRHAALPEVRTHYPSADD